MMHTTASVSLNSFKAVTIYVPFQPMCQNPQQGGCVALHKKRKTMDTSLDYYHYLHPPHISVMGNRRSPPTTELLGPSTFDCGRLPLIPEYVPCQPQNSTRCGRIYTANKLARARIKQEKKEIAGLNERKRLYLMTVHNQVPGKSLRFGTRVLCMESYIRQLCQMSPFGEDIQVKGVQQYEEDRDPTRLFPVYSIDVVKQTRRLLLWSKTAQPTACVPSDLLIDTITNSIPGDSACHETLLKLIEAKHFTSTRAITSVFRTTIKDICTDPSSPYIWCMGTRKEIRKEQ